MTKKERVMSTRKYSDCESPSAGARGEQRPRKTVLACAGWTYLGADVEPSEVLGDPGLPHAELLERQVGSIFVRGRGEHANDESPQDNRGKREDNPVEAGDLEAAKVDREPAGGPDKLLYILLVGEVHDPLMIDALGVDRNHRERILSGHRAHALRLSLGLPRIRARRFRKQVGRHTCVSTTVFVSAACACQICTNGGLLSHPCIPCMQGIL